MSCHDYGSFIRYCMGQDIVSRDPFQTIDTEDVGGLMRMAVERGRRARPGPKSRHLRRSRYREVLSTL